MKNTKINLIPPIDTLYEIQPKDFSRTCWMLGDAFRKDPLWSEILKKAPQKFSQVFGLPVRYALKYGKVLAPTDDIHAASVWVPTPYVNASLIRLILSGALKEGMKLGSNLGKKISDVFSIIEKDRRMNIQGTFVYLYVLGVATSHQGKGLGSQLVRTMMQNLPPPIPIYLETESEANVRFYQRLGFDVIKEIQVPILNLPMWEMIYRPS
jgi:ribosomal protein S18 acetylase RimI-like enzyme